MFCCGRSRDVASKLNGPSPGARSCQRDGAHSDGVSANPRFGPDTRGDHGVGNPLTAGAPEPVPNTRPIDERMLRHTPTLDDLMQNYQVSIDKLQAQEARLRATGGGGNGEGGAGNRYGGDGSLVGGGGGGRLIQREQSSHSGPSQEEVPEVDLSGYSLQTSSGPSPTSTRGSSTSEGFWARLARSGKKRKDKLVKNILAPPSQQSHQGSRYEEGASPSGSAAMDALSNGTTEDVVRVRMDGESTEERRRRGGGGYYQPEDPRRVKRTDVDKGVINEVEVIRLNDDFYSSSELRQWRRLQTTRVVDFMGDTSVRRSSDSRENDPSGGDSGGFGEEEEFQADFRDPSSQQRVSLQDANDDDAEHQLQHDEEGHDVLYEVQELESTEEEHPQEALADHRNRFVKPRHLVRVVQLHGKRRPQQQDHLDLSSSSGSECDSENNNVTGSDGGNSAEELAQIEHRLQRNQEETSSS